jgi:putative aldouronate transport system permease protein
MAAYRGHIKHRSIEPIIFRSVNGLFMILVMIVMLYPFWNTIAVSLNHSQDTLKGGITLFPRIFSTYNYETVFRNRLLVIATINSVLRTLISTVLGVFVAAMIAYVLSRREFVWRKFATRYFLVTMYISAGLIPNYFLIRDLGLINNFWVYILPSLVSVFNVIVVRSYISSLPQSLFEAAFIDGVGHFRCFVSIVLPCCKPVLATVALWCAVGAWNSWFDTFIYASSKENLTTLQYEMMKMLAASMSASASRSPDAIYNAGQMAGNSVTPVSIRAAITVVASVPILLVYPFLQKYFVRGVMIGSVKE